MEGLYNNEGYKIRCMRDLVEQIKRDYAECKQIWARMETEAMDISKEDELIRVMSWLTEEIKVFNELGKRGIEGVLQGEIGDIEKDVKTKEIHLKVMAVNK